MLIKTLRIKRVFFDRILSGEKTQEFRSGTDYYHRFFEAEPDALKLHYQHGRELTVAILGIDLIVKPDHLRDSPYLRTSNVYCIELGEIISYNDGIAPPPKPDLIFPVVRLRKAQ